MADSVLLAFAGFGAIILVGFLGTRLFERTKIPDILILIFIGLFLKWVNDIYFNFNIDGIITFIAPYFAALALIIILFDGGLNLNLEKVMNSLGLAIIHTVTAFIGTLFVTALICYYFLGITDFVVGLFLGCILGGVSSAVVLPIMAGVSAKEDTKVLLTIESVLTDVLCIVTALILIEVMIGEATDAGALIQNLLSAFILAGFIGLLFGLAWLQVLKRIHGKPFSFMVTIAALFILYAGVEYIQVSGAIAALVFGLVLSNKMEIARMFKIKTVFVFEEKIKEFHSEVSFLVRTFFFVYLGWTFTFQITDWTYSPRLPFNLSLPPIITGTPVYMFIVLLTIIFIGIFVVRYIASSVSVSIHEELKEDKPFLYSMLPRGLASAVIAALPFAIPEYLDETSEFYATVAPHEELFINVAFLMIVITVVATTVGVSSIERSRKKKMEEATEEAVSGWEEKSRMYAKHASGDSKTEQDEWSLKSGKKSKPVPVVRKHPEPPPPTPKKEASQSKPVPVRSSKNHPLVKRAEEAEKKKPVPKKKTK